MDDPMSVFWMAFEDVKEYFSAVEICRVHAGWFESRTQVWLQSGVGPGEGIDITVFRNTQVDIALWQEKHINREAAMNAKGVNIDVGFAVLRKRGLGEDGQSDYDFVDYIIRDRSDDVSEEMFLEAGHVYRVVPVSFALSQEYSPRRCTVAVHSIQKVETAKATLSWRDIAWATFEGTRKKGKKRPIENAATGVTTWQLNEGAGTNFVVENSSDVLAAVQVDASESIGCVSTRDTFDAVVALPPKSRQVVIGTAFKLGATRAGTMVAAVGLPGDAAGFAIAGDGMHEPLPLVPASRPTRPADEEIIKRAPPPAAEPQKRGVPRASSAADLDNENEEMLRLAMEMSMGGAGGTDSANMEVEDDELAAAMKLSMQASEAPAAPAAPAAAPAGGAKANLKERVKELFQEYVKSGMPPNDAAAKALADAQAGK
eukprot:TRINITY_DN35375_c0_g1_i1.p1 TRINITY_DN35375_c0_g1~~TRINITY_DN35375_c0_g1_i1.p1  ORF type:complete len:429 (+),score=122.31 TRINITY_DN35375_c0_g1_i1:217-1503(+)